MAGGLWKEREINMSAINEVVRNRASYAFFKKIAIGLPEYITKSRVLEVVHQALDEKYGYRTYTKACFANESMRLVQKDLPDINRKEVKMVFRVETGEKRIHNLESARTYVFAVTPTGRTVGLPVQGVKITSFETNSDAPGERITSVSYESRLPNLILKMSTSLSRWGKPVRDGYALIWPDDSSERVAIIGVEGFGRFEGRATYKFLKGNKSGVIDCITVKKLGPAKRGNESSDNNIFW